MATIEELAGEVERLGRRVDKCESVLQIQALKARYGELVDMRYASGVADRQSILDGLADQVAALFTVDGTWDGGPGLGVAVGRSAIAERLRTPTLSFSRHLFVKPRIMVDGDNASAQWDLICPCRSTKGRSYWMCGVEHDEYLRVDGTWLHRSMKFTPVVTVPVGEGLKIQL